MQLGIANRRVDELRRRIDGLHTDLADARTAAMFSGSEAAALHSRLELVVVAVAPFYSHTGRPSIPN